MYYGDRIRKDETNGAWSRMGKEKSFTRYLFLLGKPEGYRPLGSSRRRGEDNIKIDI